MRKLFKRKRKQTEEMSLQITSMADIFTILLVFLLKSYSTSAVNVSPSQGLLLPVAQGADATVEALKLEISEKAVQVEGSPVATLEGFRFADKSGGSKKSLTDALAKARERQLLIAKENPDVKIDSKIMVISDQRVPYVTLKSVLESAAVNGYTDFKLTVVRQDQ